MHAPLQLLESECTLRYSLQLPTRGVTKKCGGLSDDRFHFPPPLPVRNKRSLETLISGLCNWKRGGMGNSGKMDGESAVGGGGRGGAALAATTSMVSASLNGSAPPPFLSKTYDMVDDPATDAIVSWGPGNNSFVVWNVPEFSRDLLPKHFKHNNFSSFVRQLNTYGFRKVDPDKWEFANEGFLRGQKHLLKSINRRKPSHAQNQQQQLPPPQSHASNSAVGACVEVGKFGLEEEVERLKRDKNVLMQELVRLRQQQQATDHQLQTLTQRLQGMEQRQQQMMSFLAKAMQSPGFLAQLVQQNDNRRIVEVGKKRRLPKQENNLEGESSSSPDGQIVKYQPMMTEAAKAMLMQILKFDSSPRLESMGNSDGFLIDNVSSSLDSLRASESRSSAVTLKEVPVTFGAPYLPSSSDFPAIQPTAVGITNMPTTSEIPDMVLPSVVPGPMPSSSASISVPESTKIPAMMPNGGSLDIAVDGFAPSELDSLFLGQLTVLADGLVPFEAENFSVDSDMPIVEDSKLPCINDSFWEQFLVESPLSCEVAEKVDSSIQEACDMQPETVWNSAQNLEHLTEQMGLLSPQAKK